MDISNPSSEDHDRECLVNASILGVKHNKSQAIGVLYMSLIASCITQNPEATTVSGLRIRAPLRCELNLLDRPCRAGWVNKEVRARPLGGWSLRSMVS